MGKLINIVVTSTKRKQQPVLPSLQFRGLTKLTLEQRVAEWCTRLSEDRTGVVPADELYTGEHWQISRALPEHGHSVGWRVQLWICSSGYGLIRSRAKIQPYSANYSIGHPDAIMRGCEGSRFVTLQEWWARLADWSGPEPGQPRTLEQLASQFPNSPLVVVASKTIIKILEPDLLLALQRTKDRGQFFLVSGGTSRTDALGPHLLPCDARLQAQFGGARMSLNVRTVRFLLESGPTEELAKEWSRRLAELLQVAPRIIPVQRISMSDDDLIGFTQRSLAQDPTNTWSRLLRQLRDGGHRCEQKRFAAIFKRTMRDRGE